MQQSEISKALLDKLAGNRVLSAVMTTYNLELDFVELDVIPLLLSQRIGYSMDERVKSFLVSEALRQADTRIELFCDWYMFMEGEARSPKMEYLCHRVDKRNAAFHPKVIWLLVEAEKPDEEGHRQKQLLMAVGSNNLTRAGWWENIEVQHWEAIHDQSHSSDFLQELTQDLKYLQAERRIATDSSPGIPQHRDAITPMLDYLAVCAPSDAPETIFYYGLSRQPNVPGFLASHLPTLPAEVLEIISPFFAEDPANRLEQELYPHKAARLLLPLEEGKPTQAKALCTEEYLVAIQQRAGIVWAQWSYGFSDQTPQVGRRRLHAKVFHFLYPDASWFLVGSVNFTRHAMNMNAEAAFLLKEPKAHPMLEHIVEDLPPVIEQPLEAVPGAEVGKASAPVRAVLVYDWQAYQLQVELKAIGLTAQASEHWQIDILDDTSQLLAVLTCKLGEYAELIEAPGSPLRTHLKNSGFVRVKLKERDEQQSGQVAPVYEQNLMVQQVNWFNKPQTLPRLSPQEILAIYAGLPEHQRQVLLENAQIQIVLAKYGVSEYTVKPEDENPHAEFFCEYAQIFQAFQVLTQNLKRFDEAKAWHQVDYYLTGEGVDALPALITAATRQKKQEIMKAETGIFQESADTTGSTAELPGVTAYLVLLSAQDLLKRYRQRPGVLERIAALEDQLKILRDGPRIQLEDRTDRQQFFRWFETMFANQVVAKPQPQEVIQ